MYISRVISFRDAWQSINTSYQDELIEVNSIMDEFITDLANYNPGKRTTIISREQQVWNQICGSFGWHLPSRIYVSGRSSILRSLGPSKNGLSLGNPLFHLSTFNTWLFQQSTIAIRAGIIRVPIIFVPTNETNLAMNKAPRSTFSEILRQLTSLAPLTHPHPFAVVEYSMYEGESDTELIDLDADVFNDVVDTIDKSIVFPPEHYQAGVNILSFFGKYLKDQYPDQDASVRIEQDGMVVRLIVKSKDGRMETIEKALHEYQLIITGEQSPESIVDNPPLVLELRNELRMAQLRVEFQRDINQIQQNDIQELREMLKIALSRDNKFTIDFKPNINTTQSVNIESKVSYALYDISSVKDMLPASDPHYATLQDLESSLSSIETEGNPDQVKSSTGMSKFRKIIDRLSNGDDDLSKAIKALDNGVNIIKDLAGKYNSIAQWCGLPMVPPILTK